MDADVATDVPAPSELAFPFASGRLCLDFVGTLGKRHRGGIERLRTPDDLARWVVAAALLDAAPPASDDDLENARALREAIYRAVQAVRGGETPTADDVAAINAWAARPALAPQLDRTGRARRWVAERPVAAALAAVARDAVDLLSGPLADRISQCAGPDCSALFVDTSRPGHRRWCSMETCGNRAKKAAYRARHTSGNASGS